MDAKTEKGNEMKKRIMSSAYRLFSEKGVEATSVREIVGDVGCAKGTFYLYFETKMDLVYEIAYEIFMLFPPIMQKYLFPMTEDPFAQLEKTLDALNHNLKISEDTMKFLHTSEMLKLILENSMSMDFLESIINQITLFIEEGVKRGYFREVNPVLYAKLIFNICHDLMESAMLYSYPDNMTVVKDELTVIIRKILSK